MASVCVAGPSRSGETAEEQTVSKHGRLVIDKPNDVVNLDVSYNR